MANSGTFGRVFLKNLVALLQPVWTKCNELALNIQTEAASKYTIGKGPPSDRAAHRDSHAYESPDYVYIRKMLSIAKPGYDDFIYDIGAGAGRFICVAARRRVRKCVGVELLEPLCEQARRNALRLRGRKAPIDIICGDATKAELSYGTIYYMFNPFGRETMRETLASIRRSLARNPRDVLVVYHNPTQESVFQECGWLDKYLEFFTFGGLRVTFWKNRPPGATLDGASASVGPDVI